MFAEKCNYETWCVVESFGFLHANIWGWWYFPPYTPPSLRHQEVIEQSSVEVNMHSCSNSKYFMECSWLGNLGQRTWPFSAKEFQIHVHFDFGLLKDIWTGSTSGTLFNSLYWALCRGMPPQACWTYDEDKAGKKDCCFEKLTQLPESEISCSKVRPAWNKHNRAGLPSACSLLIFGLFLFHWDSLSVLGRPGCCNQIRVDGLAFSQFWRLESQDQGTSRVIVWG